jgi:branched-chain amino acid transport system permease protein
MGIGAYITALLTSKVGRSTGTQPSAISGLLTFAVGLVLGFPALRVKAHYLAFVTLAFSTLVWLVLRNEQWLTGGVFGLSNIPRPSLLRPQARPARTSPSTASSSWSPSCSRQACSGG